MTPSTYKKFTVARDNFRAAVEDINRSLPKLRGLQQKLADGRDTGKQGQYRVETPVVYNRALDDITADSEIRIILVADNPGRREQAAENQRYLVGPSGKIADKFFRDNPALKIDFRRNVIILNKTPIHTPRTVELKELCALGGASLEKALAESQRVMAQLLLEFHQALPDAQVWITGYSEMKKGGIFEVYTDTLRELYRSRDTEKKVAPLAEKIFVYRHFSMNQFTIDLRQQSAPGKSLAENLDRIGKAYRQRILGW